MNAGPAAGALAELWEQAPAGSDVAVRAPGRANLIGEHTDYNDGLVLPVALDLQTTLVGRRQQGRVRLRSLDVDEVAEVDLATGRGTTTGWGRYVTAVVAEVRSAGLALHGVDGVLSTTLPVGAGLSSSAALEVAVALALLDDRLPPVELARLCQRAEQAAVGVQTGLMDQLASVCGLRAAALLIDCRSTTVEPVPLPPSLRVLLVDSAVPRVLATTAYDERRRQCEQAAAALGVVSLRDVDEQSLTQGRDRTDPVHWRRARHVVTENARVLAAVAALAAADLAEVRRLFAASQRSMAEDFEISTPEIDTLVALAVATPGVVASRLTGGGFGGCTVSLVDADRAPAVAADLLSRYGEVTGLPARAWVCDPVAGAGALPR